MISATALGYVAGFFTTGSFLPQVVRAWRTRSTDDLSFWMLSGFSTGCALWIVYGFMLSEPPIILFNAITFGLAMVLLWLKISNTIQAPRKI